MAAKQEIEEPKEGSEPKIQRKGGVMLGGI